MKKLNKRRIVWIDRKIILHCTVHELQLHEFKKKILKTVQDIWIRLKILCSWNRIRFNLCYLINILSRYL